MVSLPNYVYLYDLIQQFNSDSSTYPKLTDSN